jgi:hypothetical protein
MNRNIGARYDYFDHRLSIRTCARSGGLECLLRLVEGKPMGDQGLQINLALCSQSDSKFVVAGLECDGISTTSS